MKKSRMFLFGAALMGAMAIGGAYAYYSDSVTVENRIQLGDLNIGLAQYEVDADQKEKPYEDDKQILPGDSISNIPRITNKAEPCYIRTRMTFENDLQTEEGLSENNIGGISDAWVKIGAYYYYKDILKTGGTVDFFKEVRIPAAWTEAHELQKLGVNLQVDAIQAANYKPDFSSETPWGDEEIEVCAHTGNKESVVNPYTTMYVEFEGKSHKLLAVPEDFFSNLGMAMPGDTLSDTAALKNTTAREAELFFHTALPEGLTDEQKDLMNQIGLVISLNGKKLYQGSLEAAALNKDVSLGKYAAGAEEKLNFTLTVPSELKNKYALADTSVKWVFSVYEDGVKPVKTGDHAAIIWYLLFGAGGIACLAGYIILKKREGKAR